MNRELIPMLDDALARGFDVLVLTNAMKPMMKCRRSLLELRARYADRLVLRVSIDHYTRAWHEAERGKRSWGPTLEGLQWLSDNGFSFGELIPARYRGRATAAVMNFWPIGAILAGLITLYFIHLLPPSVGWRLAFGLGAVLALFTLWARRVLPESPRWLARQGRTAEARRVSEQMASDTSDLEAEPDLAQTGDRPVSFIAQIQQLARRYPGRLAPGRVAVGRTAGPAPAGGRHPVVFHHR
ncbi:MAG: MFS transporter [Salinisphaera sp.]|jgi:hypothetical protein|nr:MFS transporter [Salinisphaera sp.]